jgi:phage terminase small subunit
MSSTQPKSTKNTEEMTMEPSAPTRLRPETRAWWKETQAGYELYAPHELLLLGLAGDAIDRITAANEAIATDGAFLPGRYAGSVRPHPGLGVARDGAVTLARLLRELALSDESRPPRRA